MLVERERELAMLEELLEGATGGRGSLVWMEGAPGTGKTGLIAAMRQRARERGLLVLGARGSRLERDFAFGVVRQLFEPELAFRGRDLLHAGPAAGAASVFGTPTGDDQAPPFATLDGLLHLTRSVASDGALVVVDDAHWCDAPSLRFLGYLAQRIEQLPVLALVATRSGERSGADLLALAYRAATAVVELRPLTYDGVRELAGGDDDLATACFEASGGNPLMVSEILGRVDGAEAAPLGRLVGETVADAVIARLRRQPADVLAVARAAAVLGDRPALPLVAALAGLDEHRAAAATAVLVAEGFLGADASVAWALPVTRAAVYDDLTRGEREDMHVRAARLLHEVGAPVAEVADHLVEGRGEPEEWMRSTLLEAGRLALRHGTADVAARRLRHAIDTAGEDGGLLHALGMAEALTRAPSAAEHLSRAFELAADPVHRAEIALELGRVLVHAGGESSARVVELAERAQADLGGEQLDLRRQLEALVLTAGHFDPAAVPDLPERMRRAAESSDDAGGLGSALLAAAAAQHCLMTHAPAATCAEHAARVVANPSVLSSDAGVEAAVVAAVVLALADREEAVEWGGAIGAAAERSGSLLLSGAGSTFAGFTHLRRGELDEAEPALRAGCEKLEQWGMPVSPTPAAFLAEVLVERGDLDGAAAVLERADVPVGLSSRLQLNWWIAARIEVFLAQRELRAAVTLTDEAARRFADAPPAWMPWRSLRARALHAAGDGGGAAELAADEVELARAFGAPGVLGRALRVLGTVTGDASALREAVEVTTGTTARLEHARALADLGAVLVRAGARAEARELLRRAAERARECGAIALADRVRRDLRVAGGQPRAAPAAGVESLSASERKVVDLAADGLANREIAERLFVVPRTVEVHLSNAYRKLGISSRDELARALRD